MIARGVVPIARRRVSFLAGSLIYRLLFYLGLLSTLGFASKNLPHQVTNAAVILPGPTF
jgi:hypothetical protein